jgi:hypothetical protein
LAVEVNDALKMGKNKRTNWVCPCFETAFEAVCWQEIIHQGGLMSAITFLSVGVVFGEA